MLQVVRQTITRRLDRAPLNYGSPIVLDIMNTYLTRSIRLNRDLPFLCMDQSDIEALDYDVIVNTLAEHLPGGPNYRTRMFLAKYIVEERGSNQLWCYDGRGRAGSQKLAEKL